MRLENKLNSVKKFTVTSFLITSLAFNPFYARAEKNKTIENYYKEKIELFEKNNQIIEAERTKYRLKEVRKWKKEYYKKDFVEENSRDKSKNILRVTSAVLAAIDTYQTTHITPSFHSTIKDMDEDQIANMSVEEIIKSCRNIKHKETNPLIVSLFGEHPSDGEMFLYYTATTATWLVTCHLVSKYVTKHLIPKKYNKYTEEIMLGLGNIHYLKKGIENEQVTGGILFKKTF